MFFESNFFDKLMNFILIFLFGLLVLIIVLAVCVGIADIFTDFPEHDFMKIIRNDGHSVIYRNPSNITEGDSYIKFKSEGRTYTIFYKDIKSIEKYSEDIAKGIYK